MNIRHPQSIRARMAERPLLRVLLPRSGRAMAKSKAQKAARNHLLFTLSEGDFALLGRRLTPVALEVAKQPKSLTSQSSTYISQIAALCPLSPKAHAAGKAKLD